MAASKTELTAAGPTTPGRPGEKPAEVPASEKRTQAALVLVADDFADAREMVVTFLRSRGYRTAQAADGQEAIEKAQRLQPRLVIMDLGMPVLDGWEAIRRLKANPCTRRIPVIALSAHSLRGDEQKAIVAGADAFLAKPASFAQVLAALGKLLGK